MNIFDLEVEVRRVVNRGSNFDKISFRWHRWLFQSELAVEREREEKEREGEEHKP
jgi:hypothetical protein